MIYRKVLIFLSFLGLFSCLVSGKLFSEKRVLLELKRRLSDSSGILSSWNRNGSNHCSWSGISCNSKSRVVSVIIRGCRGYRGNSLSSGKVRACQGSKNSGLVGTVSPLIGKLTELRVLSLVFNEFVGEIPEAIWGLEKLEVLDLQGNNFTGKIPDRVSGLRNLRVLNLGSNQIVGEIPLSLTECKSLEVLNLGGNELKGSIPGFFGGFEKLRRLDLSYNQLSGSIPGDIGRNCRYLEHLDLSWNFLVGSIPASLGRCRRLKTLLLPSNLLHEAIGDGFGSLHKLEVLDVLRNKLGGLFPNEALKASEDSFSGHVHLKLRKLLHDYDDSGQNFTSSASDNDDDDPPIKNDLYPIEVASIVSASVIVSALIVLIVLFLYTRRSFRSSRIQVAETKEIRVFVDIGVPLTYENIVRATGNFNNSNCIGHGGFGSTYKAEISPNTLVAVKRLSVGRFQGVQQFHAEIKTLEVVRHPNLVTLIGYHASEAEMFLVYNYLPGGNLENFIRERSKRAVEWKTIHKIALDVARALEYLHDQCSPKVLHRDVKPSNILLDNNLKAYLSDFGLSKLMGSSQTHATTGVAGTFGYVAPEYAMTCRVSEKADVYSYGIVLLELISDKKALDPSFSMHENGFNIVSWAHMMLRQGQAKDVFNVALWESGPHDDLVDILHLALKCTVASLSTRPTMKQVVLQLRQIRPS